jgi:hypothetical protein
MKTSINMLVLSIILSAFFGVAPKKTYAQTSVSFQVFYDELSPHGTWVNNSYGYVWIPNVAPGFAPYSTNGYWLLTDGGWTWISDYSWGWAPFHYGRWYTDPFYGPMWIPGDVWGPGWVTWRSSGDYYGWAPIGPGISISVAYSNSYSVPASQWTFVSSNNFGGTGISSHYINSSNNVTIINNTTVINNTNTVNNYHSGPRRSEVEQRTGKSFSPIAVKENNKPGQNLSGNNLQIYKPQIARNNSNGQKPSPAKVENIKNVKPMQNRSDAQAQKTNSQSNPQPAKQQSKQPNEKLNTTDKKQTNAPQGIERKPTQPLNQMPKAQPAEQKQQNQPKQSEKQQQQIPQSDPLQHQPKSPVQQPKPEHQQQPSEHHQQQQPPAQQHDPAPMNGNEKRPH